MPPSLLETKGASDAVVFLRGKRDLMSLSLSKTKAASNAAFFDRNGGGM